MPIFSRAKRYLLCRVLLFRTIPSFSSATTIHALGQGNTFRAPVGRSPKSSKYRLFAGTDIDSPQRCWALCTRLGGIDEIRPSHSSPVILALSSSMTPSYAARSRQRSSAQSPTELHRLSWLSSLKSVSYQACEAHEDRNGGEGSFSESPPRRRAGAAAASHVFAAVTPGPHPTTPTSHPVLKNPKLESRLLPLLPAGSVRSSTHLRDSRTGASSSRRPMCQTT